MKKPIGSVEEMLMEQLSTMIQYLRTYYYYHNQQSISCHWKLDSINLKGKYVRIWDMLFISLLILLFTSYYYCYYYYYYYI